MARKQLELFQGKGCGPGWEVGLPSAQRRPQQVWMSQSERQPPFTQHLSVLYFITVLSFSLVHRDRIIMTVSERLRVFPDTQKAAASVCMSNWFQTPL